MGSPIARSRSRRRAWTLLGVTDMVPLSAWAATHPTSRKERRRILAYHTARSRTLVSASDPRCDQARRARAWLPAGGGTSRTAPTSRGITAAM